MNTMNSKPYRRLYRDVDSRIIGGVCSGLAHYFRIDVVIIRILFIIILFGMGAGLLGYILLWIVAPPAETEKQKLEMKQYER